MKHQLTLALLLISSSNLYAEQTLHPLAKAAHVFSSNGEPVVNSNGNCIRNGSFVALGEPPCYITATAAVAEPAPEPETDAEP
ncbi:MAG: hypothetical protein QGI54_07865, partial [Gammaproteobacteria bacterium]|nr:hypothetical protein [Gammaproteobacteria bacterium]